jgi:hypothetical protein
MITVNMLSPLHSAAVSQLAAAAYDVRERCANVQSSVHSKACILITTIVKSSHGM